MRNLIALYGTRILLAVIAALALYVIFLRFELGAARADAAVNKAGLQAAEVVNNSMRSAIEAQNANIKAVQDAQRERESAANAALAAAEAQATAARDELAMILAAPSVGTDCENSNRLMNLYMGTLKP